MYDVGWAERFQNEGGEYLLFLEKSDSAIFLTPVGGPNGMVQVLRGIINNENEEISTYYADFPIGLFLLIILILVVGDFTVNWKDYIVV